MIKELCKQLREDEELYYAWQANIAMSFYDEFNRRPKRYKNHQDLRLIANNAAKNFLNMLIKEDPISVINRLECIRGRRMIE